MIERTWLALKATPVLRTLNPWDYLTPIAITDNEQAQGLASAFYGVFQLLGMIGLVVVLMISGIRMMFARNSSTFKEAKSRIMVQCLLGVALSAFTWLVGVIFSITKILQ